MSWSAEIIRLGNGLIGLFDFGLPAPPRGYKTKAAKFIKVAMQHQQLYISRGW